MIELNSNLTETFSVSVVRVDVSTYPHNDTRIENLPDMVFYVNHNEDDLFYLL
jgi:hypothetical protein